MRRHVGDASQREDHTRTWEEGSPLWAKERGLGRNQPCRHLGLEHAASRLREIYVLFRPPSLWCSAVMAQADYTGSEGRGRQKLRVLRGPDTHGP